MDFFIMINGNKIIFITGTPCVGKTSVASNLFDYFKKIFNTKLIKINDFAFENDLVLGEDPKKGYKVIDVDSLDEKLNHDIKLFFNSDLDKPISKLVIVEGHLSHLCSNCDKCIVLRLNPRILEKRLKSRNYSKSKINENLEAEALSVCSAEAYDIHGNLVNEVDTTNKSVDDVTSIVKEIILNDASYPVGNIDFMDWFLDN